MKIAQRGIIIVTVEGCGAHDTWHMHGGVWNQQVYFRANERWQGGMRLVVGSEWKEGLGVSTRKNLGVVGEDYVLV